MRSNSSELRSLTLGSLECTDPVFFPFTTRRFLSTPESVDGEREVQRGPRELDALG